MKSPIKSIREKCLECSNQQKGEVLNCQIIDCALYPFRLGQNPNRQRKKGQEIENTGVRLASVEKLS